MEVGISYDLRSDFAADPDAPEDRLEEYDSQATVDAIAAALTRLGHRPRLLGGGRGLLERLLAGPAPDLVFNIAEGQGGRAREAHVPCVLEMLGVPYTGSDPLTLAATLDKAVAKRLVAAAGVRTPRFAVVHTVAQAEDADVGFPAIAKPVGEGSSIGVRRRSRVADRAALREVVGGLLADYRQPVLIEEFCAGAEFTVGVLGEGARARVIGALEIVPRLVPAAEFVYSLEVKRNWEAEVEYHVPPRRPTEVVRAVEELALDAYRALECRDIGRVDVRLDAAGQPHFIEVNPLPGINPVTGDIVILARGMGLDYDALIGAVVDSARARWGL